MADYTGPVDKHIQTVVFETGLDSSVNVGYSGPQNEDGVKELFRAIAPAIDVDIVVDTEPFPDLIIYHQEQGPYTLEVEVSLSDFIKHEHDARACHIVLFWNDDRVLLKERLDRGEMSEERGKNIRQLLNSVNLWDLKEIVSNRTYDILTEMDD